jgi:sigma-B regulation protein RsbU (phosphoserine phosphatase)
MVDPVPFAPDVDWHAKLKFVVDMMRELSLQSDPQEMVRSYGDKVRTLLPSDRRISLSRRGLPAPYCRITRSTTWDAAVDPWKEPEKLPLLKGGILSELIYADQPRLIDDLVLAADDPAHEYLAGQRSLIAVPLYDNGLALNMVVLTKTEPAAFSREQFPEIVWLSNLFGKATSSLVLKQELQKAYHQLEREMRVVGDLQKTLLPAELPLIPTLELAAHYQPSARAGGDYYDFFPLPDGKWGIFLADVSGHGAAAAVFMAITHSIAHTHPGPAAPAGRMLSYLNGHLAKRYSRRTDTFVTAFYAVYDPTRRSLTYASAGQNPPRLKRKADGSLIGLDAVRGFPLGIMEEWTYDEATLTLDPGDQIIFYTDGITEAHNLEGDLFGTDRLDSELKDGPPQADGLLMAILQAVSYFAEGRPADDDRTLIVASVS